MICNPWGMAGKKTELGATGAIAAENVKRLRELHGLSYAELSRRLEDMGRPIPPLGLRRIETGDRRIDVDDLIALALALKSSPVTLLVADDSDPEGLSTATGLRSGAPARRLWKWLIAEDPVAGKSRTADEQIDWWRSALPAWRRSEVAEGLIKLIELQKAEQKAERGDSTDLEAMAEEYLRGND